MIKRSILGWLIWSSITAAFGFCLVYYAATVTVTPSGFEFVAVDEDYFAFFILPVLATGFVAKLSTSRRLFVWLLSFALTIGALAWIQVKIAAIEFARTPPCWGIHSIDPGSGEGCPKGMRPDFTVAELREYYRKLTEHSER